MIRVPGCLPALRAALAAVAMLVVAQPQAEARGDLDALVHTVRESACREGLDALATLSAGSGLEAQRASFLLGRCLARTGRPAQAAEAYRLASAHPMLRGHALIGEAEALTAVGRPAEAAARLREVAASADGALRARLLVALGEAEMARRRPEAAAAALASAADLRPDDAAVWLALGRAEAAAGRRDRARRALGRAAWAFPQDPVEGLAREALADLLGRPMRPGDVDAPTRLRRGARLAEQGEWAQAEHEFRAVTAAVAAGPVAGEAWYRLGEILLTSDLRAAHEAFRRAAALGWNQAGAWFWAASAARRLGMEAQAREAAAALQRVAPTGRWAGRLWLGAGLRAEGAGRTADAAAFYRRVIAAQAEEQEAAEARWRLGWIALRSGRLADAEARFRAAAQVAKWRGDAARAWYWAAKTLEASGTEAAAREAQTILRMVAEQYPLTFYGQRARSRLGLPAPVVPPALHHVPPRHVPAPVHEELARLGLDVEAAEAAEASLDRTNDPRLARFLAEVYHRLGDLARSVRHAEDALARGFRDGGTWRLAYPKAFWEETGAAAQAAGIDPLLLLALVREESRYDPRVISPARAVGLAQLLPSTARGLSPDQPVGLHHLKDPATNLALGARYLRLQLDRFDGDLRLALAAYNAGPGAARRWVGLDPDPDYFVERIGLAETRAYVRRVLGSYGIYRILW
ncbi:MAG: transglycosylase SLT domain-containing protein [Armatimonadota bacterium]|nr:transglycosylase SLT domain-containing protein [Armatimonadota bacterium]